MGSKAFSVANFPVTLYDRIMKTGFYALTVFWLFFTPKIALAQVSIPIVGADESLSQYICLTTPGVKTSGVKILLADGTTKDTTVKGAKAQIDKQITGMTGKILTTSQLAADAPTKKQRDKLKAKVKALRAQRELLKYIKSQLVLCEKAELEFSLSTVPVLLTNTVSNPTFQDPLNLFMYGFKFTPPKNFKGTYCVKIIGASETAQNLGGIVYPENGAYNATGQRNCTDFGAPVGDLCVNGLEDDEAMIILTQGAVVEKQGNGNCSSASACPLTELIAKLGSTYASAKLVSFSPGTCE